ncbi:MAG: hypothetical protein ABI479_11355 [Gallionella sp.]
MPNPSHVLAALLLFSLPHAGIAASLADKFTPGTSYYFDEFDPEQNTWEPGQYLNIEEVFKHYQYYEIVFDQDGKGITVNRYLHGSRERSERYLIMPDKSLRKE